MAYANTTSRAARRTAKKLERTILQRKIERSFTRTTENISDALTLARAEKRQVAKVEASVDRSRPLPKVAHFIVERGGVALNQVQALLAHHKEETGAVPVLHVNVKASHVHMPSCLGVFGNIIGSSLA